MFVMFPRSYSIGSIISTLVDSFLSPVTVIDEKEERNHTGSSEYEGEEIIIWGRARYVHHK